MGGEGEVRKSESSQRVHRKCEEGGRPKEGGLKETPLQRRRGESRHSQGARGTTGTLTSVDLNAAAECPSGLPLNKEEGTQKGNSEGRLAEGRSGRPLLRHDRQQEP